MHMQYIKVCMCMVKGYAPWWCFGCVHTAIAQACRGGHVQMAGCTATHLLCTWLMYITCTHIYKYI